MRIDHSSGEVLAFDNMMNRPITGTNGWNHFSIVLMFQSKVKSLRLAYYYMVKVTFGWTNLVLKL
ncbi:hypothetical protein BsIDN1_11690 [Bacillus safensis]|uniref:Uncharacterized protein n=1 Tax=Bacillus safensis TaxID=561879 RepID=A0A5S9M3K7_BACIA|nr:hypothetical protein BsIDN1_11690 [Bacillus safensis]